MLNNKKRLIINTIISFLDRIDSKKTFNEIYFIILNIHKDIKSIPEYDIKINYLNHIDDLINKLNEKRIKNNKDAIKNYLNNLYLLPIFEEHNLLEIIYWIEKVKVNDKKSKKNTDFFYDIYLYQKEENIILKKELLSTILNKLINYIKYANKKNDDFDL